MWRMGGGAGLEAGNPGQRLLPYAREGVTGLFYRVAVKMENSSVLSMLFQTRSLWTKYSQCKLLSSPRPPDPDLFFSSEL